MNQLPSVTRFNFDLARYIDDSWIKIIPHGDVISKYRDHDNAPSYISNYIMKYFDIDQQYEFEIPDNIQSIAFLESEVLVDLIMYAGAVINSDRINKIILKKEIDQLKIAIGDDAYYVGLKPSSQVKNILSSSDFVIDCEDDVGSSTVCLGMHCLLAALYDMPKCVRQRVLFKLPYEWVNSFAKQCDMVKSNECILLLNSIIYSLTKTTEIV